jgi:hypothetical protein
MDLSDEQVKRIVPRRVVIAASDVSKHVGFSARSDPPLDVFKYWVSPRQNLCGSFGVMPMQDTRLAPFNPCQARTEIRNPTLNSAQSRFHPW